MSKTIYDSDILSAMTSSMIEYDKNGGVFLYMADCAHLDGIDVADLLDAQRRAISGNT